MNPCFSNCKIDAVGFNLKLKLSDFYFYYKKSASMSLITIGKFQR